MKIKIIERNKEMIENLIEKEKGDLKLKITYYHIKALTLISEEWLDEFNIAKTDRNGVNIRVCIARDRGITRRKSRNINSFNLILERGDGEDWFLVECKRGKALRWEDEDGWKIMVWMNDQCWSVKLMHIKNIAVMPM